MELNNYIVFILSHGRADNVATYATLRRQGYTGRIGIVIDNTDKQAARYKEKYGEENVYVFDKAAIAETFDEVHKADRRTVVYARNACFDIAREIGVRYFIELDDDYEFFCFDFDEQYRWLTRVANISNLDNVFRIMWDFYLSTPVKSLAMAQGGDFIGGAAGTHGKRITMLRKCMNSFFCSTDRPFQFTGRINEDVNTYTMEAHRGDVFFTLLQVSLNQKQTQSNEGGMTDVYLDSGTYIKSFFSVIVCPSAVKVSLMSGGGDKRLHHFVSWNNCCPKILREAKE